MTTAQKLPETAGGSGPPGSGIGWLRTLFMLAETRWAATAAVLFAVGGLVQLSGGPAALWWLLYLISYATGGWEPGLAGLRALREKTLDVDLLMIVAAVVAAAIGQVFDGALLIVIFATSGALEAFATRRTEESVQALMSLAPERATRLLSEGREARVDAAELVPGDVILVRPGERVGADGEVVDGVSEVDQASITGEPLPVAKRGGDEVFAGTVNGAGALTVKVARAASDSVVARIVAMVAEASATKARAQLFIEKVEQRYSVGIVVATLALFTVPLLFGAAFETTLLRAMTFMIVASPCAVVLATMPPLLATIANAGRHGVLIKSAVALEGLGTVDLVAFDKTGTLTVGTPRVDRIDAVAGGDTASVLRYAAAAEHPSEHPVGRAVVAAAQERALSLPHVEGFSSSPGLGVTARVEGLVVRVGAPALLAETVGEGGPEARLLVDQLERSGHTAVVVMVQDVPVGVIALTDRLREQAPATVTALAAITGNTPVLFTGDNQHAGERLGAEVGIERVEAGLLPADKTANVDALTAAGHRVLLVGDGVNDAPAMAAAHVGVSMGRGGSDLAMETSDAILVHDELETLPKIIDLSRRAHRVVRANLAFASTVIAALVLWDIVGTLPLPLGVAGHEGSTIVVALNGLRLLRSSAWRNAAPGAPVADSAVHR